MMQKNEKISLSGEEAIYVVKEINLILVSLHNIGSYYMGKEKTEYERETNRFIDDWKITDRLAVLRETLAEKFDLTLGDDDMDDVERAMEGINYWSKPSDNPTIV
ncbi:MAG: hypothetical protein P8104_06900 [Gammaproteobacteria bacterium]